MSTAKRPVLPWIVWGAAVLAYVVAIINRSSLAAIGPAAQEHFGIDATVLATFAVIQLIVYAAMQIPVGLALDRFGSSTVIVVGCVLMVLGQLAMATVHEVSLAILARVLVGAGDACTFISVLRILPVWFSVRQLPTVVQLTGLLGQSGQLISVTPLAMVIGAYGWATGFVGVSALGFLAALLGFLVLRDVPGEGTLLERMTGKLGKTSRNARSFATFDSTALLSALAPPATEMMPAVRPSKRKRKIPGMGFWQNTVRLLSLPGVRLAFWVHFTAPFSATVFVLLWGTPFLTGGVGLTQAESGWLLSLNIVALMIAGVLLGPLTSRFMEKRVWIVLGVVTAIVLNWLVVLLWPGVPPIWLLAILMVVIAIGGPTSMISFEVARTHTPQSFAGFSTGFVNTAGFIAALIVILCIGLILDFQGAGSPELYTLTAFRWAFAVQIPVWLLGITLILVEYRRTARWMQVNGRTLR